MNDSLTTVSGQVPQRIRLETPLGAIESDSGNHVIDGITVVVLILVLYIGKKVVDKFIKK